MVLLVAANLAVVTGVSAVTSPASAAPDPNLGPIAPPGETFCYAVSDSADRGAFIRMIGVPGQPGFSVQVDRMRVALGRANVEALAIRPSGGIYMTDDASPARLGRMVPGLFDPTIDNNATTNPTANGAWSDIATLKNGSGSNIDLDVDGLTFIETNNLIASDDVLIGATRESGDDTIVTINPTTGTVAGYWPVIAPPELVNTPDTDGITNIVDDDVDDIAWDPSSDQIYAVLGGGSLNYMGRLVWVLTGGGTSNTIPRGVGGAPDFSQVASVNFVRLGAAAFNDVEGLGFSNVGATFGTFFGMVGDGGTNDDELLVFNKTTGAPTSLIDVKSHGTQGTGDEDYEGIDCVQPELPAQLTIGEQTTPADGTIFTFAGGAYGDIGPGDTNNGLANGGTEVKTVSAGTYVITQDAKALWSLDDVVCSGNNGFGSGNWSRNLGTRQLTVTVAGGQAVTCNFQNSLIAASIGDRIWLDADGDGVQDGGESGINGVTVTLRNSGGTIVGTQDTAGDGNYDFTNLTPGTYSVTVDSADLPNGVLATHDVDGVGTLHVATVTVTAGQDRNDVDFGYVPNLISVAKTDYAGHNAGASCPGGESVVGPNGSAVTYCFTVTNTGDAPLTGITLTDPALSINQANMTVLSGSLANLAPSQSVRLFYNGTINGDLLNTVTATGTTAAGAVLTAQDTASVDEIAPAIRIDKTVYTGHDSGAGCAGGESVTVVAGTDLTYCFVVTNTGDTTLTAVQIDDPSLGIDQDAMTILTGSTLALLPTQSVSLYYNATAVADLTNTASTSATPPAGPDPTDDDTAEVDVVAPALTIDKTVYTGHDGGASCEGAESVIGLNNDPVTYCFVVTNTGDTTLTDVQIDDGDLSIDQTDMTVSAGVLTSLDPTESVTLWYETTIDGDLENTASASATPPVGPDPTDDDTASVDEVAPDIAVEKTVYAGHDNGGSCAGVDQISGENGDPITFCFSVSNTGDTDLTDITVSDPVLGIDETDMQVASGDRALVPAGESVELYYETAIVGDQVNTAYVSGIPPTGPPPTDDDIAEVDELVPGVSIDKTVYSGHDDGAGCTGVESVVEVRNAPVTYCFVVTNTGDTVLDITIDDPALGIDETDMDVLSGTLDDLDPGDTVELYFEDSVYEDLLNTATVTGTSPSGDTPTDDDTASVDEIAPDLALSKTVYRGHDSGDSCEGSESVSGENGEAITYCFVVTNTGDATVTDVLVDDPDLGIDETDMVEYSGSISSLDPDDTVVLYYETSIDGDLEPNTATASATPPAGPDPTDTNTASVTELVPDVSIEKTVYRDHDAGASCAGGELVTGVDGQAVTYCFSVTNTGEVPLDITIDDPLLTISDADMQVLSGSLDDLPVGETVELYYEGSITGDLTNTATVTGTSPFDDEVTAEDTAEVDLVAPSIQIDKTVYLGTDDGASCSGSDLVADELGQPVTYCFVVTNTGDTPLIDVTVTDPALGIDDGDLEVLSGDLARIEPDGIVELYFEVKIAGYLLNTAATVGTPIDRDDVPLVDPVDVRDSDDAIVDDLIPDVTIDKTVYAGHDSGVSCAGGELVTAANGHPVTYCFSVTNTGEVPLDIAIDDPLLTITEGDMQLLGGSLSDLPVGETVGLYYETSVTADLTNTATVTGTSPADDEVTDADTAEVDEVDPQIRIDKTVYRGHDSGAGCDGEELVTGENGEPVTYCFTVTNVGDTDLDPVTVTDGDLGIDDTDMTVLGGGGFGTLAPTEAVTLFVETNIDGDLPNTATTQGTPRDRNGDPVVGFPQGVNDDDTAEVDELIPNVEIAKSVYAGHDAGASCAGGELVTGPNGHPVTYCFSATNTGEVPLDITIDDADLGIDQTDMTVLSGSLTGLPVGETVELHYQTTITEDLVNTASVTGTTPFDDEVTDEDTAEVDEVDPSITIDKTVYLGNDNGASCAGSESVAGEHGEPVTYCFVVTNTGDTALAPVTVTDGDLGIDQDDMTVLSGDLADLPIGGTISLYVDATIDGDLVNTAATVGTPRDRNGAPAVGFPDGVTDDDDASVDELIPQIGVAKTVSAKPVGNGDGSYTLTYTIAVQNTGEVPLDSVQLTDDLQATFADADRWRVDNVTSSNLTVNWPGYNGKATGNPRLLTGVDTLAVGRTKSLRVTVTVWPGKELGPYVNSAIGSGVSPFDETVTDISDSGTDSDPTRSNPGQPGDTGGTDDPVPTEFPPVDLVVTKTTSTKLVPANGGPVDWAITVTNNGPGDDPGPIEVVDDLPDALTYVSASGNGWTCRHAAGTITCNRSAPLAAGDSAPPINVRTDVAANQRDGITNGAVVTSTVTETTTTNNDDDAAVAVDTNGNRNGNGDGLLARTGADVLGLVALGLGLIAGGTALTRRRRRQA